MELAKNDNHLGIISIAMVPVSIIGAFAFSLIFISAPVGIVCGLVAVRRGNKTLGLTGAILNGVLLLALILFMILAITSKGD